MVNSNFLSFLKRSEGAEAWYRRELDGFDCLLFPLSYNSFFFSGFSLTFRIPFFSLWYLCGGLRVKNVNL